MRHALLFVIGVAAFAPCMAQESKEALLASSQADIQGQIQKTYDALLRGHRAGSKNESAAYKELERLKNISEDKGELVKQLAIFTTTIESGEYVLLVRIMLDFLELPPKVVIRAMAPYLDADNENLRSFVKDWFQYHDEYGASPSSLMCLNYSDYLDYVQGNLARNEETPAGFIEYIFQKSPDQALRIFDLANPQRRAEAIARLQEMYKETDPRPQNANDAQGALPPLPLPKEANPQNKDGGREIRLGERIIGNAIRLKGFDEHFQKALPEAKQQLAKLAKHDQWWARLYVAEIMRRHRELRDPKVLDKLHEDDNELVRKAAKAIGQ